MIRRDAANLVAGDIAASTISRHSAAGQISRDYAVRNAVRVSAMDRALLSDRREGNDRKRVVWRVIAASGTEIAHKVGVGNTFLSQRRLWSKRPRPLTKAMWVVRRVECSFTCRPSPSRLRRPLPLPAGAKRRASSILSLALPGLYARTGRVLVLDCGSAGSPRDAGGGLE